MHDFEVILASILLLGLTFVFAGYVLWHLIKVSAIIRPYYRKNKAIYNHTMAQTLHIPEGRGDRYEITSLDPPEFDEDDFLP